MRALFALMLLLLAFGRHADAEIMNQAELYEPDAIATEAQNLAITFSPDESTVYFVRRLNELAKDPNRTGAIWWTQRINGDWASAQLTTFSGDYSTVDPMISPDGSQMFFMSTRPLDGEGEEAMDHADLWVRDRTPNSDDEIGWDTPRHLGFVVNKRDATDGAPSVTANGVLYFFSDRDGSSGGADIYRSKHTEKGYEQPENLGPVINSVGWDGHPFIAPDESYLIFMSDRKDRGYGECDLYISHATGTGWSEPISLGSKVNTSHCEMLPYVSPGGDRFFFTRVSEGGSQNIYYITTVSLKTFATPD